MKRIVLMLLVLAMATPAMAQWTAFGSPVQRVRDGLTTVYTLYSSGNITRHGLFGREELIDNGTGTRMIAAGGGTVYCLKNNGNIWMWRGAMNWIQADNGTGTTEIWVRGGQVWCRKDNGQVWACVNPYNMQWQPMGPGFARAAVANFAKIYGE
jgi:hypothetical protein